jgi:hypothetical protein
LNAIDYMRGHRLALVWMGYSMGDLREIRGGAIGTERASRRLSEFAPIARAAAHGPMQDRAQGILHQYASDLNQVITEVARVLRGEGEATFIVATATLAGVPVRLSTLVTRLAAKSGLRLIARSVRPLMPGRRYLPPPGRGRRPLDRRMRREWTLSFRRG